MSWTKEYRAAYMREYRKKNRDWIRATYRLWADKYRDDRNRRNRKRYATDAAFRAKECARKRAYYARKRALMPGGQQAAPALEKSAGRAVRPTARQRKAEGKTN